MEVETKAQTCTVEELQEQVTNLKEQVTKLKSDLDVANAKLSLAEGEAKRYREWWLNANSKVDDMKNDVELVGKLITKFTRSW